MGVLNLDDSNRQEILLCIRQVLDDHSEAGVLNLDDSIRQVILSCIRQVYDDLSEVGSGV